MIAKGALWAKAFMRALEMPMLRWVPCGKPVMRPGGTLVVTLEPCCHHGRTPPCSEAVLRAGIGRVVIALEDPDPRVDGGGIRQLRQAGLEVISGVLREEARQQNRAFLHRVRTGRPFGVLKWAMSLDGRTALPNGASQWISGPPARDWVPVSYTHLTLPTICSV